MEKSLLRYIWNHTRKQQIWILIIVAVSMVPYFLSLDLPVKIVNGPIQGEGFEAPGATQNFMPIAFDIPGFGHVELFQGVPLTRFWTLMALSSIFLLLVVINGLFKFYINTYKGRLGERMLRRMRFDLFDRMIRFPPGAFKRMKASEVATMIKDEVEPLGGFIGDAFVLPAMLGGQALTAMIFILVQSFWLGLIAAFIVLIQGIFIPRMRKRLIILGRERQLTARELAGRVGEVFDGINVVRTNDTSNYERADISNRLGRIFEIRYDIYQWKFLVKFINNFLAQVTPFVFYSVGGFFALQGRLDIGQLVAVIAAYKDLPTPLKELIDWDQARQNVDVKYAQVIEQFDVEGIVDANLQALNREPTKPLTQPVSVVDVTHTDDGGTKVLDQAKLAVKPGEVVALIDASGSGGEVLAEALVRLIRPESGQIMVGNQDINNLPEAITGRRLAYAASDAYLFQGSMRDNLLYGLKHAPFREKTYDGDAVKTRQWEMREAEAVGNSTFDVHSDWIDYDAVNVKDASELLPRIIRLLATVALSQDVFDLGLRSSMSPEQHPKLSSQIRKVRAGLRARLESEGLTDIVEAFELDSYNSEASISENLIFGAPIGTAFSDENLKTMPTTSTRWSQPSSRSSKTCLRANVYFRSVLKASGLDERLYLLGIEIASNVIEILGELPPDHSFFQQWMFMTADELPDYRALLQKVKDKPFHLVGAADVTKIIGLTFTYSEPRYRFGLLDAALMKEVVKARKLFHQGLPENLKDSIETYDPERYNSAASLLDNALFGRIAHKQAHGAEKIRTIVREVFEELGLYGDVIDAGLDYNVGAGGKRLAIAQRQKLNLARALLKRADYIILNKPLSAVDVRSQEKVVRAVLELTCEQDWRPAIMWVLSSPHMSKLFERVVVFERGRPVEDGKYDTLITEKGSFAAMLSR
jgi:putative ABC transport system ATP-binding protein